MGRVAEAAAKPATVHLTDRHDSLLAEAGAVDCCWRTVGTQATLEPNNVILPHGRVRIDHTGGSMWLV